MVRGRNNTGPAPCAPPSIGGHPSHAAVARRSRISTSPPPRPRQGPSRRSPQPQRAAARARLGGHALPGANGPHAASAQRSRSRSPLRLGALRRSPHLHTAKRNRAQCDCGLRLQPAFLAPLSGTSAPASGGGGLHDAAARCSCSRSNLPGLSCLGTRPRRPLPHCRVFRS